MKKIISESSRVIRCIVFVILTGYLLLTMVYLIPNNWLEENVRKSSDDLLAQGVYPSMYLKGATLDSWADAECVSVTFNTDSTNPFYNAINAFHKGETDGVQRLHDTLYETEDPLKSVDHSYLWHGFRIWLRPLLCLYELSDIRCLCFFINLLLWGILCLILYRESGIWSLLPFVGAYFYFNFVIESVSLLFFVDINIMLLSCLGVIWAVWREKDLDVIFTLSGSVVAFSSMLVLPMLTIGFPIIVWLVMTEKKGFSAIKRIFKIIRFSICWLVGYAITLFTKIGLSQLVIGSGSGLSVVFTYSGSTGRLSLADRMDKLNSTWHRVVYTSSLKYDCLMIVLTLLIIYIIVHKKFTRNALIKSVPYLITALIPVVWVVAIAGHAHHFFTYYNFSIMIYSILQLLCSLCCRGTSRNAQ